MQTLTVARSRSLLLTASSPLSWPLLNRFFRSRFSSSSCLSSSSRRTESLPQNCCNEMSNVSVWWDYENCSIPAGVDENQIADRIVRALQSNGIRGPVSINALGDIGNKMPCATQEALTSSGISLVHFPPSEMYSTDILLTTNLMSWTAHNPPPAHFFLISGNRDFAAMLHRLRMDNYNVLLSCSHIRVKASLYYAATLMWPWIPLAKGENFTPQQFNPPPVGMYGSWYGHRKRLDDPFEIDLEQTRLLVLEAADLLDRFGNKEARGTLAMAKVAAPNMTLRVIDRAMQVHGAAGLSSDTVFAHMWANSHTLRIADRHYCQA